MNFGESLTEIRKSHGISRKDFAEQLEIPYTTLRNYETGQREPGHKLLIKMASLLSVSVDTLIGYQPEISKYKNDELTAHKIESLVKKYRFLDPYGKEAVNGVLDVEYRRCKEAGQAHAAKPKVQQEQVETVSPELHKVIDLPFDELKASAGSGYQLDEDRMVIWKVRLNELTRKADFCLEVDGRSMEPMIYDGDIILVRQQPSVDIGEIGLFTVNDKGYVKKQGKDRLISINDEFEDIFPYEYDTVFCRGKVIGVLDPEWIVEK